LEVSMHSETVSGVYFCCLKEAHLVV
jgi:hypothetical protein